ncbi:hypothetical protein BDV93DRAFT_360398 [Ceratobasidium sp. AG-I]|nr:hypothetical protein BDV93DRAFT_360398 [Ceratobasidium sp. AG-I]
MTLIHKLVLFLVTALTLALASPTSDPSTGKLLARAQGGMNLTCGSQASESVVAAADLKITQFAAKCSDKPREIRVYWHVLYEDPTFTGGLLTSVQVHNQIKALNDYFKSAHISFKLIDIDYTQNTDWFRWTTSTNVLGEQMRHTLHRGDYKDLNIYSVWFLGQDFLGFSTWPWDVNQKPKLDGVVFEWDTIPGGPWWDYNQGKVLAHLVGHWCGLFHTFEGGCGKPGDYISDTPKEAVGHFGCPTYHPDTCPGGGKDPIHNFMDYTNDPCKTHFTRGQGHRMRCSLAMWR